jgi:nicotinate phosphoribosyltransferase
MTQPLITSLLDTDLYKITMLQAFHHAPEFYRATVVWRFACRNLGTIDLAVLLPKIRSQIESLSNLVFMADELAYLRGIPFLSPDFLSLLADYRFDPEYIEISAIGCDLDIQIRGPLHQVALFEIPLLAIISELHSIDHCHGGFFSLGRSRLSEKIEFLKAQGEMPGIAFADFGTRRRAGFDWQREVLETLADQLPGLFIGTSNLHFARTLGLKPIGTMAHEWFQAWQAVAPLAQAQEAALNGWLREYPHHLGIALTDCYAMEPFIRDFSRGDLAVRYQGLRHDSGDPQLWGEKAIAMYERLGIDPRGKTLVFSDRLTFPKMVELYHTFTKRIHVTFGIGTNLTNDVGPAPLDIIIKLTEVNGKPVAKISDQPDKSICSDAGYLERLAELYGIERR